MDVVYFGESLQYVFNHITINIKIGNITINLLDYLPKLKQGFSTISSLRIILSTYIQFYGIDKIEHNYVFEKAFGSDLHAEFFSIYLHEANMANYKKPKFFNDYLTGYGNILSSKYDKISMLEAMERGYTPMNTNNIMDFDGDYYDFGLNGYVDGILFYNIYDRYDINNKIKHDLNIENEIIRSIENVENFDNNIDLLSLKYTMTNTFKKMLLTDNNIKLYVAITFSDINKVIEFLKDVDPRLYNNEAYHLAVKIQNKTIMTIIKNKIINLNWYERLVYEYGLGKNVARDILNY